MFQSFDARTTPATGAQRLAALRAAMAAEGVAAFLVPRADAHMGENVAPCDERLAWLTGFTGSAGACAVLMDRAGVFADGRYTLQVQAQVDLAVFTPVASLDVMLADWLAEALPRDAVVGYDPWLHGQEEVEALTTRLAPRGVSLRAVGNLVDRVWSDRPPRPAAPAHAHPLGEAAGDKRARLAGGLVRDGVAAAAITLPDSLAWLLNIRGADFARTPVVQAFGLLHADGRVSLYTDPGKFGPEVRAHLGNAVDVQPWDAFLPALSAFGGQVVALDKATAPARLAIALTEAGATIRWQRDPCALPKARKSAAELDGMRDAHVRDGAAMARFLHWLDGAVTGGLSEIDVVTRLEGIRAEGGTLRDISFETICGSGPNGAIVHYRVTRETDRTIAPGDLLLVDSGAQYADGTTDITRTVATGPVAEDAALAFTRVLQGMIAVSRARFPAGVGGRDIDVLARTALWSAGQDYDHGTGHGVGAFLGVHEGPQAISRRNVVPLEPGMILSNEPGYYRPGAFGIRIENLVVVTEPAIPAGGERAMMGFETLTLAPIDCRLIRVALLTPVERDWIDAYHARVRGEIAPLVPPEVADWLARACAPL